MSDKKLEALYNAKSTFDICKEKLDETHRAVSKEIETNLREAGANIDDPAVDSEGKRMTDLYTIIALLGHEMDKLRLRIAVLEFEKDGENVVN